MARRIDSLKAGDKVRLEFCGSRSLGNDGYTDDCVFEGIIGEGDARRAKFDDWEAYRYRGGWAYGSSAEPLRLLEVLEG
jgi:hypothetical protein